MNQCVRNDSLSLVFSSLPDQLPFFVCRIWLFGLLVDKLQWRNYWVETMEHLFYEVKVSARTSLQYEQLLPEKKFSYSFRSLKLFVAISFQCSVRFCIRSDFFFPCPVNWCTVFVMKWKLDALRKLLCMTANAVSWTDNLRNSLIFIHHLLLTRNNQANTITSTLQWSYTNSNCYKR